MKRNRRRNGKLNPLRAYTSDGESDMYIEGDEGLLFNFDLWMQAMKVGGFLYIFFLSK